MHNVDRKSFFLSLYLFTLYCVLRPFLTSSPDSEPSDSVFRSLCTNYITYLLTRSGCSHQFLRSWSYSYKDIDYAAILAHAVYHLTKYVINNGVVEGNRTCLQMQVWHMKLNCWVLKMRRVYQRFLSANGYDWGLFCCAVFITWFSVDVELTLSWVISSTGADSGTVWLACRWY